MSKILIRTKNGVYTAELDKSDLSNSLWLSLPFTAQMNMLGGQIYFEMPSDIDADANDFIFNVGDIAYWPNVKALCIFFGPTPLSGDDGKPVSKFPLIKIGNVLENCSTMEYAGDRQNITIERPY